MGFHDLMMSLPDFVKHFFPDLPLEKSREMLQEILKVVLYKGNTGHQEVLRTEGKCGVYDPVLLVLVKDIMTYMPQMKYMFSNMMAGTEPAGKRRRGEIVRRGGEGHGLPKTGACTML